MNAQSFDPFSGAVERAVARVRKQFFFEKKNQKTFPRLSRTVPAAYARGQKFFGSFF
jgi:hypothetical protein